MHFDDRLDTVLRLTAEGGAMARIQFRQLIDLLGRASGALSDSARDAGMARLAILDGLVTPVERARILREPMLRLASPELVHRLALAEPDVASAAMTAADLTDAQWLELIPALPIRARGILRHRRGFGPAIEALLERLGIGDRGLPAVTSDAAPVAQPDIAPIAELLSAPQVITEPETPRGEIGDIVRRIEAFRKARSASAGATAATATSDAPRLPFGDTVEPARVAMLALDFATDAEGRVIWADGSEGPALVGWRLSGMPDPVRAAVRRRQPLVAAVVELDGVAALAGTWRLDAIPCFEGTDGRFTGYDGRLRRPSRRQAVAPPDTGPSEADRMRQILHELRTPANAIQVAAELIQQQLYGSVPHEYRALAAAIAGDTAQLLAGFDELDRLIKLETGVHAPAAGTCDLGSLVAQTVSRLRAWTTPRNSGFGLPDPTPTLTVRLQEEDASRLVWRLLAALAGVTAPGEILPLAFDESGDEAVLQVALPAKLAGSPQAQLQPGIEPSRAASNQRSLSAGTFGIGFTLRLAAAEAAAAGGLLERYEDRIRLRLPGPASAIASHGHA